MLVRSFIEILLFSCLNFTFNGYNCFSFVMGLSIYDVHTEGGGVRLRWTHVDGGSEGQAPCGRPHRKLKLESTDVIRSSSHAKKLAYFLPEFCLWTE